MIATTMRRFLPDVLITLLKILGKYDWLSWTPVDHVYSAVVMPGSDYPVRSELGTSTRRRFLMATIQSQSNEPSLSLYQKYVFSKGISPSAPDYSVRQRSNATALEQCGRECLVRGIRAAIPNVPD